MPEPPDSHTDEPPNERGHADHGALGGSLTDEPFVTWQPTRGPVVKFIAGTILVAIALALAVMIALVIAAQMG